MANNSKGKNTPPPPVTKKAAKKPPSKNSKYNEVFKLEGTFEEIIKKLVTPKK
jgi:hypothetical protein